MPLIWYKNLNEKGIDREELSELKKIKEKIKKH